MGFIGHGMGELESAGFHSARMAFVGIRMNQRLDTLLDLASTQSRLGQLDAAIETLRQSLSMDPDQAEAHAMMGFCLLGKRRIYAAEMEIQYGLTLAPDLPIVHWAAANLGVAKRDFNSAEKHIEFLLAADPDQSSYYRLKADIFTLTGRGDERLAILQEALAHGPEDSENLAALGEYFTEKGDLENGRYYAEQALRQSPESHSALIAMGNYLLACGSYDEARQHAVAAIQIDPDGSDALYLLSKIKAKTSPVLGLWWRYATWGNRVGSTVNIIVLIVAFVLVRLISLISGDLGLTDLATGVNYIWLGIVAYSFVGPAMFKKSVEKEFEKVALRQF